MSIFNVNKCDFIIIKALEGRYVHIFYIMGEESVIAGECWIQAKETKRCSDASALIFFNRVPLLFNMNSAKNNKPFSKRREKVNWRINLLAPPTRRQTRVCQVHNSIKFVFFQWDLTIHGSFTLNKFKNKSIFV